MSPANTAPVDPALLDIVRRRTSAMRWFPASTAASLSPVRRVDLVDGSDEFIVLFASTPEAPGRLLQFLLHCSYLPPVHGDDPGWMGAYTDAAGQARYVRAGFTSPQFLHLWLEHHGLEDPAKRWEVDAARPGGLEQSNSSVIVPARRPGEPAIIAKAFRQLFAGLNPDAEVAGALTARQWPGVPALLGHWQYQPPAPRRLLARRKSGRPEAGYTLGVVSSYIADGTDGLQLAMASQGDPTAFAAPIAQLASLILDMHRQLAAALGTGPAVSGSFVAASLRERAAWAAGEHAALAAFQQPIAALVRHLEQVGELAPLQRIHGDLHLGQTLSSPTRGWQILDFEGEPLLPITERAAPDLALRDLAGLARSIDYAATLGGAPPGWEAATRTALLEGYGTLSEAELLVLRALEVDKALYEAVYEARLRPANAAIPLRALERLLE